jgi:hypothetical protein
MAARLGERGRAAGPRKQEVTHMQVNVVGNPVDIFLDSNGQPLQGGSIYIGQPSTDPTNPANQITLYQDSALSIPFQQPIKTINGQPSLNGTQAVVYLGLGTTAYSLAVLNAGGVVVMSLPNVQPFSLGGSAGGNMVFKEFTAANGDFTPGGSPPVLSLTSNFGSANNVRVDVDGVMQKPGIDYTLNGTTLSFTAPVPLGTQTISTLGGITTPVGKVSDGSVLDSSIAAGSKLYNRINDLNDIKDSGAIVNGTTDDTAAITTALTKGAAFFPNGTALTAASIPNFHSTIKTGPGAVKRGTNTFYISPTPSQTNTLFVSPTGSDTNDGLSSSQPLQTIQAAFNALAFYGPVLPGTWVIQLAAGIYSTTTGSTFPESVAGPNRVIIQGPTVATGVQPTAIIDGGNTASFGLNFNGGNFVELSNLQIQNCTTYGYVAQDFCNIYDSNVWVQGINTASGAVGKKMQQGRLYIDYGTVSNCQIGIECISGTTFTIGESSTSTANGPVIQNCTLAGALIQENSTGHFNYVTVNNCVVGLDIVEKSRINAVGCLIENNTGQGVRTRLGSSWLNSGCTLLGNAINETNYSFSTEVNNGNLQYSALWSVIDSASAVLTGTTAQTQMKTYSPGIKSNSFVWPGRTHKIVITGQFFGSGGTKSIVCQAGGNQIHGATSVNGSTGKFRYEGVLYAQDSADQAYAVTMVDSSTTTPVVDSGTHTINMVTGADMAIAITGQLSSAGDQITIRTVEIIETATP